MTRTEVLRILSILKVSYQNFYLRMNRNDAIVMSELWCEVFEDDDAGLVETAVKYLINHRSDFPPDIATIRQTMETMVDSVNRKMAEEDYWILLEKAVRNSTYNAETEFEKLPAMLQRWLDSPSKLRLYASQDAETFQTVTRGLFFKSFKDMREREEFAQRLPESVRQHILSLPKMPGEELQSPNDVNSRRNLIANTLDSI